MLNIALPKGRLGDEIYKLLCRSGYNCPEMDINNRQLIFKNEEKNICYLLTKPSDVATYVEWGSADIGIAGKDILLEQRPDIYEIYDLGIGKCRMCMAAPIGFKDDPNTELRVATKYPHIAQAYFKELNRDIEIIELHGSIELAPITGLSDVIVDIVETGKTLRENNLEVIQIITDISARLICNKSAFHFKQKEIGQIAQALKSCMREGKNDSNN